MAGMAARIGDLTAHGGVVTTGFPTVLIGKKPAARISDMHTCPLVNGVVPHVGGPFILGSFTVLTGKMPQSRTTDMLICVGPPDVLAMGCPTVIIGDGAAPGLGGGLGGFLAAMKGLIMAVMAPKYPRSVLQADGTTVTEYSDKIRIAGTAEQQANGVRQLDAIAKGPGGQAIIDDLNNRPNPTTVRVLGDPAGWAGYHPGQQSYENCAVQSSQQIIHRATGKEYTESEMEDIAVHPNDSGYTRNGGTPRPGREVILENGGVPASTVPGDPKNVRDALENNRGVVTSHDAGELWGDSKYAGSGHAVNTTGALVDDSGTPIAYTINDTGNGEVARTLPADQYERSMTGRTVAVTDNPIY